MVSQYFELAFAITLGAFFVAVVLAISAIRRLNKLKREYKEMEVRLKNDADGVFKALVATSSAKDELISALYDRISEVESTKTTQTAEVVSNKKRNAAASSSKSSAVRQALTEETGSPASILSMDTTAFTNDYAQSSSHGSAYSNSDSGSSSSFSSTSSSSD